MRLDRIAVIASFAMAAIVSTWVALSWDAEATLLIPVGVAGIGVIGEALPHRGARAAFLWVASVLLGLWVLIASFSVGVFYIPSALAMMFAAWRSTGP